MCSEKNLVLAVTSKTTYLSVYKHIWSESYVHSTVHHLDSWIKIDQLDVTCFIISLFNAQHVSNVSTYIVRSLRLICWVISWVVSLWFDVCWCYGVVRLGWCGILMQAEALVLQPAYLYSTIKMMHGPINLRLSKFYLFTSWYTSELS